MNNKGVYNLNTERRGPSAGALWALLFLLLALVGCGKKCQTVTQTYEHITQTPWRLVETTDKSTGFRKLNNFSFPVLTFALDFVGSVQSVVNNQQFDSPLCTIKHREDRDNGLMVIEFTEGTTATQGGDATPAATSPVCPFKGTRNFQYKLGRQLELTDKKTGNYYRFAPFLGIVEPDKNCTF